ncbi:MULTISPECIES: ABC transporter permease [Sinorhizobium]|uniref:ABC transporter permease n=1 Tax=Sinorhizobium americanum TaxID=194963 RepID=A0A2S3YQK2_9HYPH|nr:MULTISPECIES: ABC transporter permease subunit [Sinorhizobium]PDT34706.1 ABC transporter permease [Sinorhizobium sp. FG01]PDT49503.1 ABC transporter permease [Sinorhizobium sp. NG07B]POH33338.1 ABC transporter permease [Sinorhizobium americanum]POH33512.1 ABC transporter permease [Sinorhizobium americanum]
MLEIFGQVFEPGEPLGMFALSPPGWGGSLLIGLLRSLEIAAGAYVVGLLIGVFGAYGKLYGNEVIRDILGLYTTIVRAVPELVLILILYYAGPAALNGLLVQFGFSRVTLPQMPVGIVVLGVVLGAYMTEVLRGAILAVPVGQIEAARAYGMTPLKMALRITLPLMLGNAIPGLSNLWLAATKDTALLAVIGFSELTLMTKQAAGSTKSYFLFYVAAGILYLIVSFASGRVFGWIERWARKGQPPVTSGGTL